MFLILRIWWMSGSQEQHWEIRASDEREEGRALAAERPDGFKPRVRQSGPDVSSPFHMGTRDNLSIMPCQNVYLHSSPQAIFTKSW